MPSLTSSELIRYARHLTLAEVGPSGQERLRSARVLLVGAGGLGSPAALYLAAAGVGTIGIVDADTVELSNLQRQVLHGTGSLGVPKTESARRRLADLNPEVRVEAHATRLTSGNALDLLGRYDLTLDGSDNFPTRYLVNDASVLLGRPYVYGSIFRFDGQVSVFAAPGGPCYRCLFRDPPPPDLVPSCAEGGVLGVLPGIIGSFQACEAIKLILGIGIPLVGRLLLLDALRGSVRELALRRDPSCPACGDRPSVTALIDYEAFCGVGAAAGSPEEEISADELRGRMANGEPGVAVVDVREEWEWEIARIPGSRHLPLGELPARLAELDGRAEIVTVCHRGQRSLTAQRLLQGAGFRARSLAGGIDTWAERIDPGMARY
ncbi:MAG TPA: molybdopterin-synthase adenylyltransferase MoeB [Gemmatimonadales bacterium]|nr:molybdopterin-synthase adenylyltransferase MoeB [Gemmatimonadales bacterium]